MNLLVFDHTNPLVSGLTTRHEDDYYCSTSHYERKKHIPLRQLLHADLVYENLSGCRHSLRRGDGGEVSWQDYKALPLNLTKE
jgi:hypothetical protein